MILLLSTGLRDRVSIVVVKRSEPTWRMRGSNRYVGGGVWVPGEVGGVADARSGYWIGSELSIVRG